MNNCKFENTFNYSMPRNWPPYPSLVRGKKVENCFPFPSNFSPGHDSGLGGRVKAPTPRSSQDKPWKNNFTRFVRFRAKGKLKGRSFSPLGGNELARPLDEIDGQFLAGGTTSLRTWLVSWWWQKLICIQIVLLCVRKLIFNTLWAKLVPRFHTKTYTHAVQ